VADYNVYVSTQADRTAMKDAGEHSVAIHGDAAFDEGRLLLSWKSASPLPRRRYGRTANWISSDSIGRRIGTFPGRSWGWRTR